jgi:hypothetical protein
VLFVRAANTEVSTDTNNERCGTARVRAVQDKEKGFSDFQISYPKMKLRETSLVDATWTRADYEAYHFVKNRLRIAGSTSSVRGLMDGAFVGALTRADSRVHANTKKRRAPTKSRMKQSSF